MASKDFWISLNTSDCILSLYIYGLAHFNAFLISSFKSALYFTIEGKALIHCLAVIGLSSKMCCRYLSIISSILYSASHLPLVVIRIIPLVLYKNLCYPSFLQRYQRMGRPQQNYCTYFPALLSNDMLAYHPSLSSQLIKPSTKS